MQAHRIAWATRAARLEVAVWTGGAAGPPISSALFTLDPDGTMTVTPAFGGNGDPVLQPQNVVPEPSGLVLAGSGLLSLVGSGWAAGRLRRSTRH